MRIEPLAEHRHLIAELVSQMHAEWHDFAPWADPEAITARFTQSATCCDPFPHSVVAISDGGQFLGTASLKLNELPAHPDKTHWLGEVFVSSNLRGQGIGSRLVEHIVQYAIRHGVQLLHLYTPDQQSLYERLGWRSCGEDFVSGETVTLMVRSLDANHSEGNSPQVG